MAYIKLSTKEYPRHYGDMLIDPIGTEDFAEVVWVDLPIFDKKTHRCIEISPTNIEGNWVVSWEIREATPEEIESQIKLELELENKEKLLSTIPDINDPLPILPSLDEYLASKENI